MMGFGNLDGSTAAERRRLLEKLMAARQEQRFPTSYPQRRMWFLDQLNPGDTAYNLPRALRITGPLDLDAWRRAVDLLIWRHEALRTVFAVSDGTPVQVVRGWLDPEFNVVDRPDLAGPGGAEEIQRLAIEEFERPFDLAAGPLVRLTFLRLSPHEHILLSTIHHIVADLWSAAIFMRELAVCYDALVRDREPDLPPVTLQYPDFACWQLEQVDGGRYGGELDYWRRALDGAPATLELPGDHVRKEVSSHGGSVLFELPRDVADSVRSVSHDRGVTPFMTLFAAFAILLERYSGSDDIVIGVPTANRSRPEIEGVIGYFSNMLPIRLDTAGNPTFTELLTRTREAALGAFANENLPFEHLVERLNPQREAGTAPYFQISFIYQNIDVPTFHAGGLTLEPIHVPSTTARFDLELQVFEGDTIAGWFEYDRAIFEPETVERIAGHLRTLLQSLLDRPDEPIGDAEMLSTRERELLIGLGHGPERRWPSPRRTIECFEEMADRYPERLAVVGPDGERTYGQLQEQMRQLRRHIQEAGAQAGCPVGICLPRTTSMLAAVLAALAARTPYVPIDPGFPEDRRTYMIKDSGLRIVLTESNLTEGLALPDEVVAVAVDVDVEPHGPESSPAGGDLPAPGANGDVAYIIYTSGSTGRPKGVAILESALTNHLRSMAECPGIALDDVLVAVTTLSFDISMLELLLPLTVGGTVVIASTETAAHALNLARLVTESGATIMQATPSTWRMLLDAGWTPPEGFRALVGGEALPPSLAEDLLARDITVWNMYGPTETTIWSAVGPVTSGRIDLGAAIANTSLRVMDQAGRDVPLGVPGELWIGGDGLAQGYWKRPALTAEKFVQVSNLDGSTERFYRTGDLVRRRSGDGALEFVARLDHQVKLRGYRIELGEIEAELLRLPQVAQAVVSLWDGREDDRRLVAYVIPTADDAAAVDGSRVREQLRERLPEYMLPSHVVALDSFPLTLNGKVDRKALPGPLADAPATRFIPPRSALESVVAAIWCDVLGVERISVTDNFFDLGGHSLLSTRILVRLRDVFQLEVPLARMFREPTVAGVATGLLEIAPERGAVERTAEIMLELSQLDDDEIDEALEIATDESRQQ